MSKTWSLILVVAFSLGYGVKAYLDAQQEVAAQSAQQKADMPMVTGEGGKEVALFHPEDPRINVLYFGFTRCPDVCPTSLAMLSAALKQVDEETLNKIRPIFITLDPERDSGADSDTYAKYFHPNFEGYAADADTLKALADKYGVIYIRNELEDSALEYTVDHNSYFYFLAPNGSEITKVQHTLSPAPLVKAINTITSGTQQ
ncbi:cytochrome oxidase biogenesis protein sco1/senC/prrC [Vibrio ishigakensis]|uniref:Cytochrome oxidase biogenesis protein sco1/senC/prrC n=1 Tax=Vibrio ishigakensis TaxID=1481914 RepID=A0A0B8Q5T4_9VIBR|nr:cytochrome oxidase biogenesis protein sco1/senC/prrC [Vibrio ishigakensis]